MTVPGFCTLSFFHVFVGTGTASMSSAPSLVMIFLSYKPCIYFLHLCPRGLCCNYQFCNFYLGSLGVKITQNRGSCVINISAEIRQTR